MKQSDPVTLKPRAVKSSMPRASMKCWLKVKLVKLIGKNDKRQDWGKKTPKNRQIHMIFESMIIGN